jgi:16S rRNA (uracil1498-N3)-methyltransferase
LTSNRFFVSKASIDFPSVFLEEDEHHHLSKVARVKVKEKVWLFDEEGTSYLAQVAEIQREKTRLLILEKTEPEKPKVQIILGQALINSKKMDFILQKSTELGALGFIPVISERSVVKVNKKIEKKIERWHKVALEAAKQCRTSVVPWISAPIPLKNLVEERKDAKKLLLSENRGKYLKDTLITKPESQSKETPPSVIILVGPEGGWTEEEENSALAHGYEAISLGKNILRAETAAICALAMISHFWNL